MLILILVLYYQNFKNKGSIILFKKSSRYKKYFANAHYNLGAALTDIKCFKKAELSRRKAIKINPREARAHLNLGSNLNNLGKFEEDKSSFTEAIRINKDIIRPYFVHSLLITNKESFEYDDYHCSRAIIKKARQK